MEQMGVLGQGIKHLSIVSDPDVPYPPKHNPHVLLVVKNNKGELKWDVYYTTGKNTSTKPAPLKP